MAIALEERNERRGEFLSYEKCTRGRGIYRVREDKSVAREREKKEIRGEERRKKEEKKIRAIGSERERKRGEEIERERKEREGRKRSSPCGSLATEVISIARRREGIEGREGEGESEREERVG